MLVSGDEDNPLLPEADAWDHTIILQLHQLSSEEKQALTTEELMGYLTELERKWIMEGDPKHFFQYYHRQIVGRVPNATDQNFVELLQMHKSVIAVLYNLFVVFNHTSGMDGPDKQSFFRRFTRLFTILNTVENLTRSHKTLLVVTSDNFEHAISKDMNLSLATRADLPDDATPCQKLYHYLLDQAYFRGLKRRYDQCYKQTYTRMGDRRLATRSWEPSCTMRDFIMDVCGEDYKQEQWLNLTKNFTKNVRDCINYLSWTNSVRFQELEIDRHRFSFANGIFDVKRLEFWPYTAGAPPDNLMSCHYHNIFFDSSLITDPSVYGQPEVIETPMFDSIFETQRIPKECMFWIYALLGRLFFDLKEIDDWQVILFVKGLAGTGKTSIGKIISSLYSPSDVAIMSTNMEAKFGLSAIYEKYIWICNEVSGKWTLTQPEFMSIVEGGGVSIAIKNVTAKASNVPWTTAGIMFGNEDPPFQNVGGNMQRRLLTVPFDFKVRKADPTLVTNIIEQELTRILIKCVLCYHIAVDKHGRSDIWDVLPEWFKEQRRIQLMENSPLLAFINSEFCDFNDSSLFYYTDFHRSFNLYITENGIEKPRKLNFDKIRRILGNEGLQVKLQYTGQDINGDEKTGKFIVGIAPGKASRPQHLLH